MRFVSVAEFTIIDSTGCRASSTSRTPRSPACSAIARSIEELRPHASSLGSKFLRNIYNVLKVRECAGTRLIPARRDIPRLGVVLFGTKPHNPNPIPL